MTAAASQPGGPPSVPGEAGQGSTANTGPSWQIVYHEQHGLTGGVVVGAGGRVEVMCDSMMAMEAAPPRTGLTSSVIHQDREV